MAEDKMQTDEVFAPVPAAKTDPAAVVPATPPNVQDSLKSILALVERSVKLKETRLTGRLLRQTAGIRSQLTVGALTTYLTSTLPADLESRAFLLAQAAKVASEGQDAGSMQDDAPATSTSDAPAPAAAPAASPAGSGPAAPEIEAYSYLLMLMFLVDNKKFDQAQETARRVLERLRTFNRRTLDGIAARIYFYCSLAYESTGALDHIRSTLLALHRTAVLRHDVVGQETLMNLLLRNYLHYSLYDQAEKFRSKVQKSDQFRSNAQFSRYLYYLGRIRAIQLEYSDAKECLMQADRKAPAAAHGFRITVVKWLTLVRLLLGEVPERAELVQPGMATALLPYLEVTQAVRSGDLVAFAQVAEQRSTAFRADGVSHLVTRLHHNVLRTGLRRISLAYSRISLADVADKLHLSSVADAECIVAKAIRDGGIDATIDHEGSFMASREVLDVYSTSEPQAAFHARIAFCLDIHNDAVKAMRFEPDAHRRKLETAEARQERLAQEAEFAKHAAEEDGDDDL